MTTLEILQLPAPIFCQAFHPTLRFYAVGCVDGTLKVYKHDECCSKFDVYHEKSEGSGVRAVAFKDEYLIYGLRSGQVACCSVKGFVEAFRTPESPSPVTSLLWIDSNSFVVGFQSGDMSVYNRTYTKPLRAVISGEFKESINDMCMHPDGDKFYAVAGGQLGLFSLTGQDHGTRLLAMSDENDEDIESIGLFYDGKRILCSCADHGMVIFFDSDLGTHKERLGDVRFPIHSLLKLEDEFFLAAGETGQILVGQLYPNQWIGVMDELKMQTLVDAGDVDDDAPLEADDLLLSVDSMACDCNKTAIAFIENSYDCVLIRSYDLARAIYQGKSQGKKTEYAEFMDEL